MGKDDAPPPRHPPSKRRHLERVPDFWLRIWLEEGMITLADRNRIKEEIERRKESRRRVERRIGLLIGPEGVTPEQLAAIGEALAGATEVHHSGVPRAVHRACKRASTRVIVHQSDREVILNSQRVIAAPRSVNSVGSVWELTRYARHRRLIVQTILPNGEASK